MTIDLKFPKILLIFMVSLTGWGAHLSWAEEQFRLEAFSEALNRPWGMVFLDDGRSLVTERRGKLLLLSVLGKTIAYLDNLPKVTVSGQGGLLDIALHPEFSKNQRVYLCYSQKTAVGNVSSIGYGFFDDNQLQKFRTIFSANRGSFGGRHFGCRIRFDDTNRLFFAIGERGASVLAQDPTLHPGSILALTDEGKAHPTNPHFDKQPAWAPEIYAIGIRNPQGLYWDQRDGVLYEHEHGPQGGDELNRILKGLNYGWPVISYGERYGGGKIGVGTSQEGMVQPDVYWSPSIAPSGLIRYQGSAFESWYGDFFIGSLKFKRLLRLRELKNNRFSQHEVLSPAPGRVRDVLQGPDGYLYILLDERAKPIYRLIPDTSR